MTVIDSVHCPKQLCVIGDEAVLMIRVLLLDGPTDLPAETELPDQAAPQRLTVDFQGWHQHFERTDASETVGGRAVPVYRWIYRTAIAE